MISDLHLALVGCPQISKELKGQCSALYPVGSLKELVRLLMETPLDGIIFSNELYKDDQFAKIYKKYNVPAFVLDNEVKAKEGMLGTLLDGSIVEGVKCQGVNLSEARLYRENKNLKTVMEQLTLFTDQVIHTKKDVFITETKNFFKENFKIRRCHWVEVKEPSFQLPPILKLRQELKKQKVDQSSLIKELNNCTIEVAQGDGFQVWQTQEGYSMAFLWVPGPVGIDQCIILNKFKVENRFEMESFLNALIPFLRRRWALCLTVEDAQEQIYRDSLTDLYNQKFLGEVIDKKIEEHKRYKTPFSVLFIDVDHFKRVNDSLGHIVGSGVLSQMGGLLRAQIRNSDYAFRYGGDEFILLLSHTEGQDAVNVAERVRETIEKHQFDVDKVLVNVTVSIGLAFYPEHAQSAKEIVKIADEAMYYGKNKSRNIVYKAS